MKWASAVIVDSVFIVPHMLFAFINIRIFSLKEVMPNAKFCVSMFLLY